MSPLHTRCTLAVAVLAAAGLTGVAVPAGAATRSTAPTTRTTTTLGPGVALHHQTYVRSGAHQSVYWVSTRMSARAAIVVSSPHRAVGATPMTTLALARQERAIAGVNGDTFYFDDSPKGRAYTPTLGPRGGFMRDGVTYKAPLESQNAVLSITRTGRAYIGDVGFRASFTAETGGKQTGGPKKIASVNSVESAWNGNITFLDPNRVGHSLRGSCSEAVLTVTSTPGRYLVSIVHTSMSRFTRLASGTRGLLTCGSRNTTWFRANLHAKRTYVTTAIGYRSAGLTMLISGTNQLVRAGRAFHDTAAHRALNAYGSKRMPESFVCVSKDRRTVSFGVFEGHKPGAAGVTYAEAASWLISTGRCWEAMALDGSTSSQLVAQRPGSSLTLLNRATASQYKGGQRPQTDGIFVVTR